MTSIYERALGAEFDDLHPKVRERFAITSDDGVACIGRGTMDYVRNGGPHVYPFLLVGATHDTMFPEQGTDVPFVLRNYAFEDPYGREMVTWLRTFEMPEPRRFDAAMVYSEDRDRVVDYLGSRHHLAVDVHLSTSDRGGVELRTGAQRLYALGRGVRFPLALSARAHVHEWYDDAAERYRVEVEVWNPLVGPVFEYAGRFEVEWLDCGTAPEDVRPESPTEGE